MNIKFSFDETNVQVGFENQFVIKDMTEDTLVKILMLKGEKGDQGVGENNVIEEVQVNGTALPVSNKAVNVPIPVVDNALSSSSTNPVQNKVINNALSGKVNNSDLNNYYQISEVDNLLNNKIDGSELDNYYTKTSTDSLLNQKVNISDIIDNLTSTETQKPLSANQGKILKNTMTNEEMAELRKTFYNNYHLFSLPSTMNSFFNAIRIYESNNKQNYKYFIDEESLKNTGGSIVYVDKDYTGTSTGTSDAPYKNLQDAFTHTNDGDTIIVKAGIYYRNKIPQNATTNKNNVNIICEDNTIFTACDSLTWSVNTTYSNVYQASRSNAVEVIDYNDLVNGIYSLFTKLSDNDVVGVSNTKNSWCRDSANTTVYVNNGGVVDNSNTLVQLSLGYSAFTFEPSSKNMHIYIENATFLNHTRSMVQVHNASSYDTLFVAKNCKFLFGTSTSWNALEILGASAIFINCLASHSQKDGFNYHQRNSKSGYAIEINCIGSNNGLSNDNYNNGSTIHDGYQILRINGTYFNNKGGNVTDVHDNTLSVNINCKAFDSLSDTNDGSNTDFCVQQSGATMYLYNCFAKGNSYKNIWNATGGTMYVSNCSYDSSNGTITEI